MFMLTIPEIDQCQRDSLYIVLGMDCSLYVLLTKDCGEIETKLPEL